jgi:hypothetical protein
MNISPWMENILHNEIWSKINHSPHYPKPIQTLAKSEMWCRRPGLQPFTQSFLRQTAPRQNHLTNNCFEYGNTRFPPKCLCDQKYDCKGQCGTCGSASNCNPTCSTCNHNSNVIFF